MHSFARRFHQSSRKTPAKSTKGLVIDQGWYYDVMVGFMDTVMFRGQVRDLRRRTASLAQLHPGDHVLDVGCGTGTLALYVQRNIGSMGHVAGIDPGAQQIARARAKAAQRHAPIDFQIGVIEHLDFPDQTFDAVLATLMIHHLPAPLKRQGLAEMARVLKPGGRLVIADFTPKKERQGRAARFHAGGSSLQDLVAFVQETGLSQVETEEMPPARFSAFPGAGFVRACKNSDAGEVQLR